MIGVPHYEEEIKAVLVLKAGKTATAESIVAWSRQASYKYPRLVEIVAALPMTATGKVLKRELRKTA